MSKITDSILNTIKQKKIAPKPRWHFILRQVLLWVASVASIIIGSITFSVILFRLVNNDWEFINYLDRTPLTHAFYTLPYIWIIIMLLFGLLAYYNAKHTKGAYKYNGYWLVIISLITSMAIGGILYAFGIAPKVHMASEKIPIFKDFMYDRDKLWMEKEGFLAGEITEMLSGVGIFKLTDINKKDWTVLPDEEFMPVPEFFILEQGAMVKIFGEQVSDDTFKAIKIMPYEMGPGVHKGGGPGRLMNGGKSMQINYLIK